MFFPEGILIRPTDDKMRTAAKLCQLIYNTVGNRPSPFPEGTMPLAGDDYARLLKKINAMQQA